MSLALKDKGMSDNWKDLVDLKILKKQCSDIIKMRQSLRSRLLEVQLKHLEADIREVKAKLEGDNFLTEDYERYEALKNEKNVLLNTLDALV